MSLRAMVLAGVLSVGVGVASFSPSLGEGSSPSPTTRHLHVTGTGLWSWPLELRGIVSDAVGARSGSYRIAGSRSNLRAENAAQRMRLHFSRAGVQVAAGTTKVGLALRAWGYGSSLSGVGVTEPTVAGNRVTYRLPGLSAWFANGPLGLEEGFTVSHAPARHVQGPLTLVIALSGNTMASLAKYGQSVTLTRRGIRALRYTGLSVSDARMHKLRSSLLLERGSLLLRVNARGAHYPLRIDPFIQQGEPFTGAGLNSLFGFSVALSADGNTAIIGSPGDSKYVGAAFVFTRTEGKWTQQSELTAAGEGNYGQFGYSVALSSDGNTALIGAPTENAPPESFVGIGSAWVFTRSGTSWIQDEKLTGGEECGLADFGYSVALSSDARTAMIGGPYDNGNDACGHEGAGSVWAFTRSSTTWMQQGTKLSREHWFGWSVALSSDGNTALIGAKRLGAWVFTRTQGQWTQQGEKLLDGEAGESSVALSSEGNTALISGSTESLGATAAWAFTRSKGKWTRQGPLLTGGPTASSVALSSDGNTALIGEREEEAAWVFTRSGHIWLQQGEKLAGVASGAEFFGHSVALSCGGSTALIGGSYGDGAAWFFANGAAGSCGTDGVGPVRAWGWGVSDGAAEFEICTSSCEEGAPGGGAGQLNLSRTVGTGSGVATDSSGDVFVADTENQRIDEFSSEGLFIRAWGWGVSDAQQQLEVCTSSCQAGLPGEGAGQFDHPTSVATDSSADVFVADTEDQRIDEFSSSGSFIRAWGWGVFDGQLQLEVCTSSCKRGRSGGGTGQLNDPGGVATDSSGDVLVADGGNSRIDEFSPKGLFIRSWGWGVSDGAPQLEICMSSCQTGLSGGGAGQLNDPGSVATDPSGDVFIADHDNWRIDEFTAAGSFVRAWGWGVSDGQEHFEVCTSSCQSGSVGAHAGQFDDLGGVATDASGEVFVAEETNSRIDEFTAAGSFVRAWGWGVADGLEHFEVCTSSCQYGSYGGGTGELDRPVGIASGGSGVVYIADSGNSRIDDFNVGGGGGGGSAPTVVTTAASNVQSTSATLNGTVTSPEGPLTECYFEYGETVAYGNKITCNQSVGQGITPVPVSAAVTGLTPGTTYHFRVVAVAGLTGYGPDETFTTLGTSPPTVTTGYVYTGWGPQAGSDWQISAGEALATGVINPHGHAVEYEFVYEPPASLGCATMVQSEPVPRPGPGPGPTPPTVCHTGRRPLGSPATSPIEVSASLEFLWREVPYHVQLGVYDGNQWIWGAKVEFEITPPEPEATQAPYLEADGSDAAKGYDLRCQPGSWRNTNGSYQFVWYGGFPSEALGNVYHVTGQDRGHAIECGVTPYRLDGSLATPVGLLSNSDIPQVPDTLVLPQWMKQLWIAGGLALASYHFGTAVFECLAAAELPGLGEAICAGAIIFAVGMYAWDEAMRSNADPPDSRYTDVALPESVGTPSHPRYPCRRHTSPQRCRRLGALATQYAADAGQVTGLMEALAVSRNRTLVARAKKDTETELVQQATRKVYAGLLGTALATLERAGQAYANGLRSAHIDVRRSARALRRIAHRKASKVVSSRLVARMLAHGYTRADIRSAMSALTKHVSSFDLQRFLRTPLDSASLSRYYNTLDLNDLVALAIGLGHQHILNEGIVPQLLRDLDKARAACTSALRAVAIERFLQDAKPSLQAKYFSFLSTAAEPLKDGSSTADPYPRCLS